MKMTATLIAAGVALAACGLEAKDAYMAVLADRSALIEGFSSYAPQLEVKAELGEMNLAYVVKEVNRLDPNDLRPSYEIVSMTVPGFTHLEHRGELEISFFNNRLMETRFFPQDIVSYLKALNDVGLTVSKEDQLRGDTSIWTHKALDGRHYVGWVDRRLDEVHTRWIMNYS